MCPHFAVHDERDKCRRHTIFAGELLYESLFSETFTVADAAISRAMGRGQQVVDDLLQLMSVDEAVET